MIDKYNREIDYVRISITDRCNLRCVYCMPKEGVTFLPHSAIMTYEEIVTIAECFGELGIRKIKLTGGEPLIRKDVSSLVGKLKQVNGIEKVTLTTNGIYLEEHLEALAKAGIDGINISLDTLDQNKFIELTGFDGLLKVRNSIDKALAYQSIPIKINCVPLRQFNDRNSLLSLAALAKNAKLHVRFIEIMPLGYGKNMESYSEQEILDILGSSYSELEPYIKSLGNGPGRYYNIPGFQGKIGFISAVSHEFCSSCNRVRLTSTGILKTCLQYSGGMDLKVALREGSSKEELKNIIKKAIDRKPESHVFTKDRQTIAETLEEKGMSQIGG
ncbi:MAG: moaA2 [Anaerocolumna sp.]|jgi:cyclic pyranopterin phosphate synthase|nr:moaA2 [Anaerocolumna sp.]